MNKYFLTLIGFLIFSTAAFAQTKGDCAVYEPYSADRRLCEENAKELDKKINKLPYHTRFMEPAKELLPETPNAWILHIVTFGGISGKGLPTVTIRSNGEFACGEDESLAFKPLETGKVSALSEIISSADFTIPFTFKKVKSNVPFICQDCYYKQILLARRNPDGKVKVYENNSKLINHPLIADTFRLIEQNAGNLAACAK